MTLLGFAESKADPYGWHSGSSAAVGLDNLGLGEQWIRLALYSKHDFHKWGLLNRIYKNFRHFIVHLQ